MAKAPTDLPAWQALADHHAAHGSWDLRQLFADDPGRVRALAMQACGWWADHSKHLVTPRTVELLVELADQCGLPSRIEAMFDGAVVNPTEHRPALHVALRMPRRTRLGVDGTDVVARVHGVLDAMGDFADQVRSGRWTGVTGQPVRNVVNIGIGGSDLGPAMAHRALAACAEPGVTVRFVSNVDPDDLAGALAGLDPAETVVVVVSKTFTTSETMANADAARRWLTGPLGDDAVGRHMVAVTSAASAAVDFGIDPACVFGMWDWVGGRYSLCSAVGLSLMVSIGPDRFAEMLAGFHAMDEHFRTEPLHRNLPVLTGLLGVWYRNFLGAQSTAVIPYAEALDHFPAYLQQLAMESLGKQVTVQGQPVGWDTGAVWWGAPGTDGQHSFMQLLHQGTTVVPVDFIGFARGAQPDDGRHDMLVANMLAQAGALAFGTPPDGAGDAGDPVTHRVLPGNRPSTVLLAEALTPHTLGALVALYEHAVFTQAAVWDINPFDQWGVERGKQLAGVITDELRDGTDADHDPSTAALIARYRQLAGREPGSSTTGADESSDPPGHDADHDAANRAANRAANHADKQRD